MALPAQICLATSIPGTKGTIGNPGLDGVDGTSASTVLTADFTMPAQTQDGNASVLDSSVFSFGQPVFLALGGTLKVDGIPDGFTLTLRNLRDDGILDYPENAAGGTIIPAQAKLTPTGFQGAPGSIGGIAAGGDLTGNYPNPTLIPTGTAGVYGDATHVAQITTDAEGRVTAAGDVPITFPTGGSPGGAAGGSLVGSYPNPTLGATGVTPGAYGNGSSWPIITVGADGRLILVTVATPTVLQRSGLLGSLIGAHMDVATDQPITLITNKVRIDRIIVTNPNLDLTAYNTLGGIYTGVGKSGNAIVAAGQQWGTAGPLNSANKWLELTLAAFATTDLITGGIVYLSLSTAQVAPPSKTVDIYLFGDSFP
jgi:hypothetical protein